MHLVRWDMQHDDSTDNRVVATYRHMPLYQGAMPFQDEIACTCQHCQEAAKHGFTFFRG
jgi:hypothetical protein